MHISENKKLYHRIQLGFRITLLLGFVAALCAIFLLVRDTKKKQAAPRPRPHFDVNACRRLAHVSRIYRIAENPASANDLWFATDDGLRMLQGRTAEWVRFGLEAGLPSETAVDLCFGHGIPWVATGGGMAFLDSAGNRFTVLAPTAGKAILSTEYVPGAGVYYYVRDEGLFCVKNATAKPQKISIPGVKPEREITCLRFVNGHLFAGVKGYGLFSCAVQSRAWKMYSFGRSLTEETYFWDVLAHGDSIWVATSARGMWRGRISSDTLSPVANFPCKGAYAFSPENDGFWCGTPWGLWRYYFKNNVWMQFIHPQEKEAGDFEVFALCARGNLLWFGSKSQGAGYLNKVNVEWVQLRGGLSRPNVAAIAGIGTDVFTAYGYLGGTMDRFKAATLQYVRGYGSEDGITDPTVQSFAFCNNRLYYGSFNGFGYMEPTSGRVRHFERNPEQPVVDVAHIVCPAQPPYFLASLFGAYEYFPRNDSFACVEETRGVRVTCLYPAGNTLYYGTLGRGLHALDLKQHRIVSSYLESCRRIVGIAPVAPGNESLFIATDEQGCFFLSSKNNDITPVPIPDTLFNGEAANFGRTLTVMRRINGRMWVGTRDAGCLIYSPGAGTWERITELNGLVGDKVRALYDDSLYIWVGCYGGMNRLDKDYYYKRIPR